MRYEKAYSVGLDIFIQNGIVPGCPKSIHYLVREKSLFIDEVTGIVAHVSHGSMGACGVTGWSVEFEDTEKATEVYKLPGRVFWIRGAEYPWRMKEATDADV
jgi:hypothetical protein